MERYFPCYLTIIAGLDTRYINTLPGSEAEVVSPAALYYSVILSLLCPVLNICSQKLNMMFKAQQQIWNYQTCKYEKTN